MRALAFLTLVVCAALALGQQRRSVSGSVVGYPPDRPEAGFEFHLSGQVARELFRLLEANYQPATSGRLTLVEGPDFSCAETIEPISGSATYGCRFNIAADGSVIYVPAHMVGGGN